MHLSGKTAPAKTTCQLSNEQLPVNLRRTDSSNRYRTLH